MFTAEASHEAILEYFRAAIAGAGVSGTAEVLNGSHFGPIPGITSSDGPHFKAVKQAIQEVWRYNNESVRGRCSKELISPPGSWPLGITLLPPMFSSFCRLLLLSRTS